MAFAGRKVVPDISQALVDKAGEINYLAWGGENPPLNSDGSSTPDYQMALYTSPGATWLRQLRDEALSKINKGQMSSLISANVNGESFTRELAIDAAAMLDQANIALRELLGTEVRMTYSYLSGFPH